MRRSLPEYARTIAAVCRSQRRGSLPTKFSAAWAERVRLSFREDWVWASSGRARKALGAGVPIVPRSCAGCAGTGARRPRSVRGGLLACRAALVFLERLTSGPLDHVARMAPSRGCCDLKTRYPAIATSARRGTMWGVELNTDALVSRQPCSGLLANRTPST